MGIGCYRYVHPAISKGVLVDLGVLGMLGWRSFANMADEEDF